MRRRFFCADIIPKRLRIVCDAGEPFPLCREEFGNFHFGYVGAASLIGLDTLYTGSLLAEKGVYDENEKTDWLWIAAGFKQYNEDTGSNFHQGE